VNRYVNQTPYQSDMDRYGIADYWATPGEFLGRSGDCEDYAIAKYVALGESGTASDDLRLVVVRDARRKADHAVVAIRFDGEWLILDNRHLVLVKAAEALHYSPCS
jgi:predicted transglutaminase-like cysteine proteinase